MKPSSDKLVTALQNYVKPESVKIQDIELGIAEADRGEIASADELNSFFAKYGGLVEQNSIGQPDCHR